MISIILTRKLNIIAYFLRRFLKFFQTTQNSYEIISISFSYISIVMFTYVLSLIVIYFSLERTLKVNMHVMYKKKFSCEKQVKIFSKNLNIF